MAKIETGQPKITKKRFSTTDERYQTPKTQPLAFFF
jgi:hypothetical protein